MTKMRYNETMSDNLHTCSTVALVQRLTLGLLLLLAGRPLMATPLATYIAPPAANRLLASENLLAVHSGRIPELQLSVRHPAVAILLEALQEMRATIVVESLNFWPKPAKPARLGENLTVYNILRSVGSMQGIEYYSASRKTMRLFYEYSSLIRGPDDQTAVADSWQTSVPGNETLFARQKDLSFGDNIYRIELKQVPDGFLHSISNLTSLTYNLIPVARPGNMLTQVLVLQTQEGILFYVVSGSNTLLLPGLKGKLETSFSNRATAIFNWFTAQALRYW